jgi:RNase P/RNase MRP subunit p29
MNTSRLICLLTLAVVSVFSFRAQAGDEVDGVTVKGDQVYFLHGDSREILADNLKFPSEVEVTTNGTFTVAKGKERRLGESQIIRRDGWLLNPDGSVEPVFDHLAMKAGQVQVVRDGQAETLTKPMSFPNGLNVAPDGSCVYPSGASTRLQDGQLFRLDGTPILSKDTASLKNGHVVVQKDGTMMPLADVQIMGMNDGTRVHGDGLIEKRDGASFHLREGQTILIDGALINR